MTALLGECRSAARGLLRRPGFSSVAVLTLALGIAATTVVFSALDGLLLRPLPYPTGERLVQVHATHPGRGWRRVPVSPLDFLDWREQSQSFERLSAGRFWFFTLSGDGEPEQVHGMRVTPGYFASLGVRPALGRSFGSDEGRPGRDRVVLLTHGLWERRFGADPDVVGREVAIDAEPFTVVGVLPRDFWFYPVLGQPIELWMPLSFDRAALTRDERSVFVHGLLEPGVSLEQARAEMTTIAARLAREHPHANRGWSLDVEAGLLSKEAIRPQLLLLFAAVGLVLLVACANVANLMLARAVHRRHELALRTALGASRTQLLRSALVEAALLACVACAAAIVLAGVSWRVLLPLLSTRVEAFFYGGIDADGLNLRVLAFAAGASLSSGLLVGLIGAPTARANVGALLRAGGKGPLGTGVGSRAADLLLVAQVALALTLSISAGLMVRSLQALQQADRGLDPRRVLTAQIWPPEPRYPEPPAVAAFHRRVLDAIEVLPGVSVASAVSFLPLSEMSVGATFEIESRPPAAPESRANALYYTVAPEFFRTLRIPLLAGRPLGLADSAGAPAVAVVGERLAERYWPDSDPLGERLRLDAPGSESPWAAHLTRDWITVVGVAASVRGDGLWENPAPVLYLPAAQNPSRMMHAVVRTERDPLGLAGALRSAVWSVDADQPISFIRPMEEVSDWAMSERRLTMRLLVVFALVTILLAGTGVYAVVSYAVSRRTRELGVRMALGGRRGQIAALVVSQGLKLAGAGLAVGVAAAFASTRLLAHQLFGVTVTDPATFVCMGLLLLGIAGLASYLPARRASRLDPVAALRHE